MPGLKNIYNYFLGKDYTPIWQQFCTEQKGMYIVGKYDAMDSVSIVYRDHEIIFDRYIDYRVVGGTSRDTEFTRVRVEFKSKDGLLFRISNQGVVANIVKLFGVQDIKVGNWDFDNRFMVKGNNEAKVKMIFANPMVESILLNLNDVFFELLDEQGICQEEIVKGNTILYFFSKSVVRSTSDLYVLFELYKAVIDELIKQDCIEPYNKVVKSNIRNEK